MFVYNFQFSFGQIDVFAPRASSVTHNLHKKMTAELCGAPKSLNFLRHCKRGHNFVFTENSESEIPNKEVGVGHTDLYAEPPKAKPNNHIVSHFIYFMPKRNE